MIERDFTLKRYTQLCETIVSSSYIPLTVQEFLIQDQSDKSIILRHDVDRKPDRALKMALIEHEIGYHYEVLDIAKGDIKKAIEIFGQELKDLRETAPIKTICIHGIPMTSWVQNHENSLD